MRLSDYLDKGASLGPASPCLTMGERTLTYGDVQQLSWRSPGRCAGPGSRRREGRDPVGQRPDRLLLRVRDRPGRRRVVPDQSAQRGRREP